MPNTLAHIALQSVFLWGARKRIAVFPLILLTAVIPDIAWVVQRAAAATSLPVNLYELRAYAVTQASLFLSLVLAAGCAALFRRSVLSFAVIAVGCVLHLLFDALQIKWANGVSLLAPFDWRLSSWGLIWPEHIATQAATLGGLMLLLLGFYRLEVDAKAMTFAPRRMAALTTAVAAYFLLPLLLLYGPTAADNHFVRTLQDVQDRPGKPIELDRRPVLETNGAWQIQTYAGEIIGLIDFSPPAEGTYSIRGRFVTESLVAVDDWHLHRSLRDIASIVGLALIGIWFLAAMITSYRIGRSRRPPPRS
jgi:hypothetical protein